MDKTVFSTDELLNGTQATYEISLPTSLFNVEATTETTAIADKYVVLRPISIGVFQLILKAAREDSSLIPLLMIKEALVDPCFTLQQVKKLPLGLVQFLMLQIREISGLTQKKN